MRCSLVSAPLAAVLVCCLLTSAVGYTVRHTTLTDPVGRMDFETSGYCTLTDPVSHTMMPISAASQMSAFSAYQAAAFSESVAIGGEARQAACLSADCEWQFNHGLYYLNELTFFAGIIYKGEKRFGSNSAYHNFNMVTYPNYWANVSYWGARQPVMASDGSWQNINVVHNFRQWVCEYYEFSREDANMFPTYPNGDVIPANWTQGAVYSHCGQIVERDSQGRWIDIQCKKPLSWWAGLIIAVIALIVVVALIIIIWCCCCFCEREEERKQRERVFKTKEDNPARIPTQSEVGFSRSTAGSSANFDDENENDYSRPSVTD